MTTYPVGTIVHLRRTPSSDDGDMLAGVVTDAPDARKPNRYFVQVEWKGMVSYKRLTVQEFNKRTEIISTPDVVLAAA